MKKFICALLSLAMLALFAGCRDQKNIETDTTDASSGSVEAQVEDPSAAPQPSVSVGKFAFIKDKKGDILRSDSESKIWAGVVGDAYILLRNTSDANEWGEKGRIYELHCAQFAGKYSMWSDGFWEINDDGTELTLTPKNQSENGNIGVAAGKSKTFKGQNGVFSVPVTFEQGGKTTIKIDFNKVSK